MPFPSRIGPTELGTSISTILTATFPILLRFIAFTNRTAGDLTGTLHIVPFGSIAANGNKLADAMTVLANDFRPIGPREIAIPLQAGDTLQGFASGAGIVLIGAFSDEKGYF